MYFEMERFLVSYCKFQNFWKGDYILDMKCFHPQLYFMVSYTTH